MLTVLVTEEFKQRYLELPPFIKEKARRRENLFRSNPFHPSLHTEKLNPKQQEVWSFRIDKNYRIIFKFYNPKIVYFLTVGHHQWIYKYLG